MSAGEYAEFCGFGRISVKQIREKDDAGIVEYHVQTWVGEKTRRL